MTRAPCCLVLNPMSCCGHVELLTPPHLTANCLHPTNQGITSTICSRGTHLTCQSPLDARHTEGGREGVQRDILLVVILALFSYFLLSVSLQLSNLTFIIVNDMYLNSLHTCICTHCKTYIQTHYIRISEFTLRHAFDSLYTCI